MRVAITGGIAEGKSTVLGYLRDGGYPTFSSDVIAREIFEDPEVNALLARAAALPPPVGREALREAILRDPSVRRSVNRIMHPRVGAAQRAHPRGFFEVPLLVEACLQGEFDRVWVVTCGAIEQRRRLRERLGEEAVVEGLLAAQLPTEVKVAFADLVLRTNEPPDRVRCVALDAASRLMK
jgi:dephospho-CoA kinase